MRPLEFLLLFCGLSGSAALRGPREVVGQAGGSLAVTCQYETKFENHWKWWCREADLGGCQNSVEITKEKQVVTKHRVSIRDDKNQSRFTVTMDRLRNNDAGTYWCGVDRAGPDLRFPVIVTISPANTGQTNMTTTITKANNDSPGLDSLEVNAGCLNVTCPPNKARPLLSCVYFLLLVFLKVPLLLVLIGAIVWASWSQRGPRKGTETLQSQSTERPQNSGCQAEPASSRCRARSPPSETLPAHS